MRECVKSVRVNVRKKLRMNVWSDKCVKEFVNESADECGEECDDESEDECEDECEKESDNDCVNEECVKRVCEWKWGWM